MWQLNVWHGTDVSYYVASGIGVEFLRVLSDVDMDNR